MTFWDIGAFWKQCFWSTRSQSAFVSSFYFILYFILLHPLINTFKYRERLLYTGRDTHTHTHIPFHFSPVWPEEQVLLSTHTRYPVRVLLHYYSITAELCVPSPPRRLFSKKDLNGIWSVSDRTGREAQRLSTTERGSEVGRSVMVSEVYQMNPGAVQGWERSTEAQVLNW